MQGLHQSHEGNHPPRGPPDGGPAREARRRGALCAGRGAPGRGRAAEEPVEEARPRRREQRRRRPDDPRARGQEEEQGRDLRFFRPLQHLRVPGERGPRADRPRGRRERQPPDVGRRGRGRRRGAQAGRAVAERVRRICGEADHGTKIGRSSVVDATRRVVCRRDGLLQ